MVKRILTMALVVAVLFSLSLSASARWDGADQCSVSLSFWGSTASCSAIITANERTAKVTASISLYRVNSNGTLSNCATWPVKTGTGKLSLSGSYSRAVSGNTYRLIVSGTIKDSTGTHSISASDTEVCP